MIKDRQGDSAIVAHARRELEMAGLFEKKPEEDYDGSLGRGALAIIKVYDQWSKSDGPKMQALHQLFNALVAGEILSPPTTDPEEWERIERDDTVVYRNKRQPFYLTNDHKFRTWTNMATQEQGACKDHLTGEMLKYEPPKQDTKAKEEGSVQPPETPDAGSSIGGGSAEEAGTDQGSSSESSSDPGRRVNTRVAEESPKDTGKPKSKKAKPSTGEAS